MESVRPDLDHLAIIGDRIQAYLYKKNFLTDSYREGVYVTKNNASNSLDSTDGVDVSNIEVTLFVWSPIPVNVGDFICINNDEFYAVTSSESDSRKVIYICKCNYGKKPSWLR